MRAARSAVVPALCVLCGLALSDPAATQEQTPQRPGPQPPGQEESAQTLVGRYLEAWQRFYPSTALRRGISDAIWSFDDVSPGPIGVRQRSLRGTLQQVERLLGDPALSADERVDLRLLRRAIRTELLLWQEERPHRDSLAWYVDRLENALPPVVESALLSPIERSALIDQRLDAMTLIADSARAQLQNGRPADTRRARNRISALKDSLARERGSAAAATIEALERLESFVDEQLTPRLDLPDEPILGRELYAERLAIYTDRELTPEALAAAARQEIDDAKRSMLELAREHWRESRPGQPLPDDATVLTQALDDVESDRPANNAEYLLTLRRYSDEVEQFVRENEIATVPERNTLSLELAPESSGPMARIGYVSSAPPFAPNPWTTWNLATIPDTHPAPEREDFWRSFNYPFKKFIVIHELYPGHYLQQKLLRENLHPVRILFPYDPFTEGWATFTERIVLDAGYAPGDRLTRLAQLRKRIENANRAYTSVMAHCEGWSEEQVTRFSIETSLLAPQFAKSLWGRLMRSPMQIITYMLGGLELRELYEQERARLGDDFVTREFMDSVLRAGPVPTDGLAELLRSGE